MSLEDGKRAGGDGGAGERGGEERDGLVDGLRRHFRDENFVGGFEQNGRTARGR